MLNATTGVVKRYVEKGHNVLLVGDHGVGKTTLVRDVVKQLGWRMVEFNAALMEPYVDFIGIPMSRKNEDGTEELQMVSKREIFDADLIFVDEFNRGQPATINALMNIINDHQLNGQPLPNLKAVVAACNPPKSSVTGDAYMVGELDPAQVDRFTVHLTMSNEVNEKYLADVLGMFACRMTSEPPVICTPSLGWRIGSNLLRWHALVTVGDVENCRAPVAERKKGD